MSRKIKFTSVQERRRFPIETKRFFAKGNNNTRWRLAFFVLLGLVIVALAITIGIWLSISKPAPQGPSPQAYTGQGTPITATVPLKTINEMVDRQLASKNTPVHDAQISFSGQRVRIDTTLYFFGRTMGLTVWMRPEVQPNGDLRLVAEDVQMGSWPIPLKTLFAVLEGLPWPPWVHVQAEQYTLDFALSERVTSSGYQYRIQNIDYARNNIDLLIYLHANKSS